MNTRTPVKIPRTNNGLGSRNGRVLVTCTFCGNEFERYQSQTKMPDGRPRKVFKCKGCRRVSWQVRFERMIDKSSSPKGCHIWNGALNADGYPHFPCPEIGEWRGNRIAWIKSGSPIPSDKPYVLHKQNCHNRKCVNPDHLYCGTQKENMRDAIEQGIKPFFPGSSNPNAILDESSVLEIRTSKESSISLCEKYGVTSSTIRDVRNRSWKHVSLAPSCQKPLP